MAAIIWRHENGAKWRAVPTELGPWWMAAQTFIRWSRLGVWERLLRLAQERGVALGMAFLDATAIRAHQKAAGGSGKKAAKRRRSAARAAPPRRSASPAAASARRRAWSPCGGGRAVAFTLAPGQAHELPHAIPLLARLPDVPLWVVADRGYSSHAFRQHIWDLGARPAVPAKRNEAPLACPDWAYASRSLVENLLARLKE